MNLVAPGWIPVERHGDLSDDDVAGYRAEVPLGRMGIPEDVAFGSIMRLGTENPLRHAPKFMIGRAGWWEGA